VDARCPLTRRRGRGTPIRRRVHTRVATRRPARHSVGVTTPAPLVEDDEVEARSLAAAIADRDADPRTVPHEEVRAWLLRLAQGEFDAPPPEPR
jgi:hypothetical protein